MKMGLAIGFRMSAAGSLIQPPLTPSNPLGPGQKKIRPEKLRDGLPMTQMQGTASKTHPPGGP